MKLYDILMACPYNQVFHVYVGNAYDENIVIGHGPRRMLMDEDETEQGIDHLMDRVDFIRVCRDGALVIVLRDRSFYRRASQQYSSDYVKSWDRNDPETRPWRYSSELECYP